MLGAVELQHPLDQPWNERRRRLRILLGIISVYLLLCCTLLPTPGLEYDEVLYGDAALGTRLGSFITYEWTFGELRLPVMLMTYIGAVRGWLYAPIFAVFGVGPWTVRLPMIALGVVTLLCVERFVRPMFGARVALLATALLAIDPSFVFGTRQDYGFISIMLVTKCASLALLALFASTQRTLHLFFAFLLLGVGLFDKFNFAWHLGAVGVAAIAVWPKLRMWVTKRNIGIAALGFLTGCWPLIVYNIATRGGTLSGVEPESSLSEAFMVKSPAILATLEGTAFSTFALGAPPPGPPSFLPWALALAFPAALVARGHLALRWFVFCGLSLVLIVAAIAVTPQASGGHHAMMLWPFVHIVIAASSVSFVDASRTWTGRRSALGMFAPATVLTLILTSISLDIRTLMSFRKTGGLGIWSDAIYELAGAISSDTAHRYLYVDWGMSNQVLLLSSGKVRQQEIYYALSETGVEDRQMAFLHGLTQDPQNRFVLMAPGHAVDSQPQRLFQSALDRHRLSQELLRQFKGRDGREVYRIVRVVPGAEQLEQKRFVATSDRGWLRAERAQAGCIDGVTVFSLEWNAPGVDQTEVHVSAPDGPLFSRSGPAGKDMTGQWVTSGMTFYLQDTTPGRTAGAGVTIARLQTDFDCP